MIHLYRARLVLIAAVLGALAIVAFELPFGEILHQRGELAAVNSELAAVTAHNSSLSADISALSSNATIAAIAHEEYGLVRPGQRSFVILPAASSTSAASDLGAPSIPPQDLVAAPQGDAASATPAPSTTASRTTGHAGLWSRVSARLEFWRWAF